MNGRRDFLLFVAFVFCFLSVLNGMYPEDGMFPIEDLGNDLHPLAYLEDCEDSVHPVAHQPWRSMTWHGDDGERNVCSDAPHSRELSCTMKYYLDVLDLNVDGMEAFRNLCEADIEESYKKQQDVLSSQWERLDRARACLLGLPMNNDLSTLSLYTIPQVRFGLAKRLGLPIKKVDDLQNISRHRIEECYQKQCDLLGYEQDTLNVARAYLCAKLAEMNAGERTQ